MTLTTVRRMEQYCNPTHEVPCPPQVLWPPRAMCSICTSSLSPFCFTESRAAEALRGCSTGGERCCSRVREARNQSAAREVLPATAETSPRAEQTSSHLPIYPVPRDHEQPVGSEAPGTQGYKGKLNAPGSCAGKKESMNKATPGQEESTLSHDTLLLTTLTAWYLKNQNLFEEVTTCSNISKQKHTQNFFLMSVLLLHNAK